MNNMSINNLSMNKGISNQTSNNDMSKYIKYQKRLTNDSNIYEN
jgi:hypothetical protein